MAKRKLTDNPAEGLFNKAQVRQENPPPASSEQIQASELKVDSGRAMPGKNPELVVSPKLKESRSQRKQILLQPSVHDRAEAECKRLGISMNEAINQLLINWLDGER